MRGSFFLTTLPAFTNSMLDSTSFTARLLTWYDVHQRRLPWRLPPNSAIDASLNPYHVLISEAMLQQTQVATVIPYFHRFVERFPTPAALATADLQDVLHAWQGLGYYSRARNLQKAASVIVDRFGGQVPSTVDALLTLPGVGRYTAGAVASLAFGVRAPILDGNVIRVICRLDAITDDPRLPSVRDRLWARAEEILPTAKLADFNSALMELGATVCTPRSPKCLMCPVRDNCEATARGLQESIPVRKPPTKTTLHKRWVLCVEHKGRYLIERRPLTGRWAGLWQFVTIEPVKGKKPSDVSPDLCTTVVQSRSIGTVTHALTHRRYRFEAHLIKVENGFETSGDRRWATLREMLNYPMSIPQQKIRQLLDT